MTEKEIKEFLNEKYLQYNIPAYIDSDPIQVPHSFSLKEDIEISAFLTATIAWGLRKTIVKSGEETGGLVYIPIQRYKREFTAVVPFAGTINVFECNLQRINMD